MDERGGPRCAASAAVLAGGASLRMGSPKALLPAEGRPLAALVAGRLAELFPEVFFAGGGDGLAGVAGLRVVPDREPGMGPLMGIASALEAARFELLFVAACDMPEIDAGLVGRLYDAVTERGPGGKPWDCAVPRAGEGRLEPLFAFYRKSALPAIEEALGRGERSVRSVYSRLRARFVDAPMPEGILNLNTPEDYARWAARLRERNHERPRCEEETMNYEEKARDLRERGFNCAQCVFAAAAPRFGIDENTAKRAAAGLGGGLGGLQGPCGAVTGGILVIGAAFYDKPGENNDPAVKAKVYEKTREFVERFRSEFGSVECLSLLGVRIGSEEYKRDAELYKNKCANFIERACLLVSDVIAMK